MVLAVDIGNSNIVLGGYQDGKICFISRISTDQNRETDQYAVEIKDILALYGVAGEAVEGIVVASVVPAITPLLLQALEKVSGVKPLLFSHKNANGIEIAIENPTELGVDILASALAVKKIYILPALIIDMGTATKFTVLDKGGILRGVAIAPGLFVSLKALVSNASALAGISIEAPQSVIGRNTAESMKSGVVFGAAAMLDGMIDRFAEEVGVFTTIVATGGAAPVVVPHCRHEVTYSDTLLLDGLCEAYMQHEWK